MVSISFSLPDDYAARLEKISNKYGLSSEELISACIENLLTDQPVHFLEATDYILNKNKAPYQRLAAL